jgi:hypothetical protein
MRAVVVAFFLAGCYSGPQAHQPEGYAQQQWGQPPPAAGEFFCTSLESRTARGSMCFGYPDRCEEERRRAEGDGMRAAACRPQSPVACFQLGDDPNPSMEMCAASFEDCDLLRLIDRDKNGRTGATCEWRHGPGLSG